MNLQYPIDDGYLAFKHIEIIKCKEHKFIIIGWNSSQTEYNAILISKIRSNQQLRPLSQLIREFGPFKTMEEIKKDIQQKSGGYHEKQSIFGHGIIGFHRFLQGYYLTYIKEREAIAKIGRHKIYEIKATQILQLFESRSDGTQKNEKEYRKILLQYKVENYYFSYTYDLTNTLPRNMVVNSLPLFNIQIDKKEEYVSIYSNQCEFLGISEMFHVNHKLVHEFYMALGCKKWILSIIHGFAKHISMNQVIEIQNQKGRYFIQLQLQGGVAIRQARDTSKEGSMVKALQIVINYNSSQDTRPVCSSFVQVRGSVPTYWMQKPGFANPKPAIEIRSNVDYMCVGTRKHFHDMVSRYGRIIFCMNLMKQKEKTPRQSELSKQYQNAVLLINKNDLREENAIHYSQIDMKFELKRDKKSFIQQAKTFAYFSVLRTGIFVCSNPSTSTHQQLLQFQNGVIRANCVDCLDRTNSFQQLVGEAVLVIQLNRLIGQQVKLDQLQLDQSIMQVYSKLYEQMGDVISIQYGSSLAHKQKIQKTTQSRFELFTSITRHWNNTFNDQYRQMQIDVFLGYSPDHEGSQIWQIKPIIEHYPNESVYFFQKMKKYEWFDKAYNHFLTYYHFKDFQRIAKKQLSEMIMPKMQKIVKEQLIHKFRSEIVASMINEKQEPAGCCWLVEPKVLIKQQVWKEINPRSATIRTLQEQLNLSYNKMDFLKSQDAMGGSMSPIKQHKNAKQLRKLKTKALINEEDVAFMKDLQNYVEIQLMDIEELELIENIWKGEFVGDDEIEKNVKDLYVLVNEDIEDDDFLAQNTITEDDINNELKRVEANLAVRNFIGNGEESDTMVVYRHDLKPELKTQKSLQPRRREMARENKVKMLSQIMSKTFSLGGVSHIAEI